MNNVGECGTEMRQRENEGERECKEYVNKMKKKSVNLTVNHKTKCGNIECVSLVH